jgi:TetR/AcrR family fatty acid metabolism transcriptional regulator
MNIHSFLIAIEPLHHLILTRKSFHAASASFSPKEFGTMKGKSRDKYYRILEAAAIEFAKKGFHQSTVSQIARQAGVADGTIYLYFKNKDDILVQFFRYKTDQVFKKFREQIDPANAPLDKLKRLIRCHLECFQKDRNMAVVYQAETRRLNPLLVDHVRDMTKAYLNMVAEIVEKGQQEGSFRKNISIPLVKHYVLGAVDEVINTWILTGGKYDLDSMADPLADLILRGIGTSRIS